MSAVGRKERRFSAAAAQALAGLRGHLVYVAVFSAVANILLLAPSLYSLQVYDRVVSSRSMLTLMFVSIALVAALTAFSVLDQLRLRLLSRAGLKLDRELAPLALKLTLMAPSNDPVRRQGLRDLDRVRGALSGAPVLALIDLPWSLLFIGFCFLLNWAIGALALFGSVLLVVLAVLNERAMSAAQERSSDTLARTYAAAEAAAQQSETVVAMGMGSAVVRRIIDSRLEALATQLRINFTAGGYQALIRGVRMVLQSAALGVGAAMVIDGKMSAGAIFAASLLTARALGPTEAIVGSWKALQTAWAAWRRVSDLTAEAEAMQARTALPAPSGRVRLDNIVVRTGVDTFALRNVNLEIAEGEMIGVIGPSGAGKSTFARVVVGALRPDGGRVSYDGADQSQWDRDRLGRFIGWLPQEVSLLSGTVAENIARFEPRTSANAEEIDAAVVRAATLAGAHEMILKLPKGYQTPITMAGRGLSGGQAQRVALARAVYRDPPICVFDEPDAHVDADSERALLNLLQTLKTRQATTVLIGHRAGLMRFVDRLVVLEGGVVASVKTADQPAPALGGASA